MRDLENVYEEEGETENEFEAYSLTHQHSNPPKHPNAHTSILPHVYT